MPFIDCSYLVRKVYNIEKEKGDVSITECVDAEGNIVTVKAVRAPSSSESLLDTEFINQQSVAPSEYIVPMLRYEKARSHMPPLVHHRPSDLKNYYMESYSYMVLESYKDCMSLLDFLMVII